MPFQGIAEIDLVATLAEALVLDASKQPIPAAPISEGASGFVYPAPEPGGAALGFAALAALALRARRREALSR